MFLAFSDVFPGGHEHLSRPTTVLPENASCNGICLGITGACERLVLVPFPKHQKHQEAQNGFAGKCIER